MPKAQPASQSKSTASPAHIIRLRGPWQCELHKSSASMPPCNSGAARGGKAASLTVKLPVDWSAFLNERSCDAMVWRRSFGRATNLGHRERVELVIEHLRSDVMVRLNEVQIEPIARTGANTRFDLTNQLKVRNQLVLEVRTPSPDSRSINRVCESNEETAVGPFGEVYLEFLTGG